MMIKVRSLREAFNRAVNKRNITNNNSEGYNNLEIFVRQRFTAAYLRAQDQEERKRLKILFEEMVNNEQ